MTQLKYFQPTSGSQFTPLVVNGTLITVIGVGGITAGMNVINNAANINTTVVSVSNGNQFVVASASGITTSTQLNIGTWISAVVGSQGPQGADGSPGGAQGPQGPQGAQGGMVVGGTATLSGGSSAYVTSSGDAGRVVLYFGIPQGYQGFQGTSGTIGATGGTGAQGAAATIAVGGTTTGAEGTQASVTNSGTSSAAQFYFTIPVGATGSQGATGAQGSQGSPSAPITLLESLNGSVYGHSFTQGDLPINALNTKVWPPANKYGVRESTWPWRLAQRMGLTSPVDCDPGIRNSGVPGTLAATTNHAMIGGSSVYPTIAQLTSNSGFTSSVVNNPYQWNPGFGYADNSISLTSDGNPATAWSWGTGGDKGMIFLQCAVNDSQQIIQTDGYNWVNTSATSTLSTSPSYPTIVMNINPTNVSWVSGTSSLTIASGSPVPNVGQSIYVSKPSATTGSVATLYTVLNVSGTNTVTLDRAINYTTGSGVAWPVTFAGDRVMIGANRGIVSLAASGAQMPASGYVTVNYGVYSKQVNFTSFATFGSALASGLQSVVRTQQPGVAVTTSGFSSGTATFDFSTGVSDIWIDFTTLVSNPYGGNTTGTCGGSSWTLTNTTDSVRNGSYFISGPIWSGTPYAYNSSCTVLLSDDNNNPVSYNGSTGGLATLYSSLWYGMPPGVYTHQYTINGQVYSTNSTYSGTNAFTGHRSAWKSAMRTMLRYARCDVAGLSASNGSSSGIAAPSGYHNGFTRGGQQSTYGYYTANGITNNGGSIGTGATYYLRVGGTALTSAQVMLVSNSGTLPKTTDSVYYYGTNSTNGNKYDYYATGIYKDGSVYGVGNVFYNNPSCTGTTVTGIAVSPLQNFTGALNTPYSYTVLDWTINPDSLGLMPASNENFQNYGGPFSLIGVPATGNINNNGNLISNVNGTGLGIAVGQRVTGRGIPTNTTITAISGSVSSYTLTVSNNCTETLVGTTFNLVNNAKSSILTTATGTYSAGQQATPRYKFNLRDRYSMKEVVGIYRSYSMSPKGTTPSGASGNSSTNPYYWQMSTTMTGSPVSSPGPDVTGWNANLTGDSWSSYSTYNRVSGYPFYGNRGSLSIDQAMFGSVCTNLSTTGGNGTAEIEKSGGYGRGAIDSTGYEVEFDGVFTTTSIPPWVVLVPEYTSYNDYTLNCRSFVELKQAYMDIAAEPEFAWYVSAVPPWTVPDVSYLNENFPGFPSAGYLHPNDKMLSIDPPDSVNYVRWIQNYLYNNVATYYYSNPQPIVNSMGVTIAASGTTNGLGSRMGYQ